MTPGAGQAAIASQARPQAAQRSAADGNRGVDLWIDEEFEQARDRIGGEEDVGVAGAVTRSGVCSVAGAVDTVQATQASWWS